MHSVRKAHSGELQSSGFPGFFFRDFFDDKETLHHILQGCLLPEQIELLKHHRRTFPELQHIRLCFLGEINLKLVQPDRPLVRHLKQIDGPQQG
ncbi:hypothetical protein D3C73_1293620 [compost metagenome]